MTRFFKYLLITLTIVASSAFAYLNGIPTITNISGALYGSFDYSGSNFTILNAATVNVTTLKILGISISPNIGLGQTVTVSYSVQNTSTSNAVTGINAGLNFYKPSTGSVTVGHFTVSAVAGNPNSIAGGVTSLFQFRVTPTGLRTTGNYIVDGDLFGTAEGANDRYFASAFTGSAFTYTAAVTPSITRENPSTLNIATLNIISPVGAMGGNVSTGQSFTISFNVNNLGDSDIIGIRQVQIDWQGGTWVLPFTVNTPINQILTAGAAGAGQIVTAQVIAAGINPTDELTGAQVNFLNRVVTLSINVVTPAQLDITAIDVATASVLPSSTGMAVTVGVRVANIGGAAATLNPAITDLTFTTTGLAQAYTYSAPGTQVLAAGSAVTLNYYLSAVNAVQGLCTVSAFISGTDRFSGAAISTASSATEVDTFWVRNSYPTLNLSTVGIVSPNGAIDTIVSQGQDFVVSFNVQNLSALPASPVGGTQQVIINWQGSNFTQAFVLGQPVTYNLNSAILGTSLVTVSIDTSGGNPTDVLTGGQVFFQRTVTTLSVTVQTPAQLDILSTSIPTSQVNSFQAGPVTISVQVQNIGVATAQVSVATNNVTFVVSGNDQTSTYISHVPQTTRTIAGGQVVTIDYVIDLFGGGVGICTVNVTLNAIDLNSSWNIVTATIGNEVATYNVTNNAGVGIGAITITPSLVSQNGSFLVYVPITGTNAGETMNVRPATQDVSIISALGGAELNGVSFNVTSVIPVPFQLIGLQTRVLTYSVTILGSAVSGDYLVNVRGGRPVVTDNATGNDKSDPDGGIPALLTYDPISPNVLFVTANINNVLALVTQPTDNFRLILEFSETLNATSFPFVTFSITGAVPTYNTGAWNVPTYSIFTSGPMNLITANQGYVTVSVVSGVQDLAGNRLVPSYNVVRFFVDATTPNGAITINNGEVATSNPLITVNLTLVDNYSATNNMQMLILPASGVSSNPGISINTWVTYNQVITLNLDTNTFATKNIFIQFRDEAGNISSVASDSIFFDTDSIFWVSPNAGEAISTNFVLKTATSIFAHHVDFYVSVNGAVTLISSNVAVDPMTGTCNYQWPTNLTTANAELLAVVSKNGLPAPVTANLYPITIDNTAPTVTVNLPPAGTYTSGVVTLSATASDNALLLTVNRVEIYVSVNNVLSLVASINATDILTVTYNLGVVPDFTTFNIVARAFDAIGNTALSPTVSIIKYSGIPSINIVIPTSGAYVRQQFTVSGNVNSYVSLNYVLVTTAGATVTANLTPLGGIAYAWDATINTVLASGSLLPVTINAYTNTLPAIVATRTVQYIVDETSPNIVTNLINGMGAVGTINITGSATDAHSGVYSVAVSIDAGTWVAISPNFSFNFGITQPTHDITFRVIDNAYPTGTIQLITYTITRDYSLLPRGGFTIPVSGDYVNNTMSITVTASAWDGTSANAVWMQFSDGLGYVSAWLTANNIVGSSTWNVSWLVPQPTLNHGITYNAVIQVRTNTMTAAVSPAPQAIYIKDIYGASLGFSNVANGSYLPSTPFPIVFRSFTQGALVSAAYVVIDGVQHLANLNVAINPAVTLNTSWVYFWDFAGVRGSTHQAYLLAYDRVGNRTTSNAINLNILPSTIVTTPLPPSGVIVPTAGIIYATSINQVLFTGINTLNIVGIYIDDQPGSHAVTVDASGNLVVTMAMTVASMNERAYVIAIFETNGVTETIHYQPVVFDRTPPTINVVFNGVARYYPGGFIAPNEQFVVNMIDHTASGAMGSGFGYTPYFWTVTDNPTSLSAGTIQRSLFSAGTTTDNTIVVGTDAYNPYTEQCTFRVSLSSGRYDLVMYAVDNAGNTANVTFNVFGIVVDDHANGESGQIDTDQFISSYPNPYDPNTQQDVRITYYLKDNARRTKIYIYNEIGELLEILDYNGVGQTGTRAGYNEVYWDATDRFGHVLSNGVYLYMIVVEGDKDQTHAKGKMVVLRR